MYAVIFRAEINALDEDYDRSVESLRNKAFAEYGCVDFCAVSEGVNVGDKEIAISYWNSLDDVQRWREDIEHAKARAYSHGRWYTSIHIDVVEVLRSYEQTFAPIV